MNFLEEIALLVTDLGLGTYTPTTVGGNVFLLDLPDAPDLAIDRKSVV